MINANFLTFWFGFTLFVLVLVPNAFANPENKILFLFIVGEYCQFCKHCLILSLFRCIRCPTAYHHNDHCMTAGTLIITKHDILCPKHYSPAKGKKNHHVNASWCFMCRDVYFSYQVYLFIFILLNRRNVFGDEIQPTTLFPNIYYLTLFSVWQMS